MKKLKIALVLSLFVLPLTVLAQSDNAADTTTSTQNQNAVSTQTQNAGEETQIQTQTQLDVQEAAQVYAAQDEVAGSRSSEVAKSVESMLTVANRVSNPEIGEQIRVIAKAQNQAEDNANKAIDKANERSGFVKFLIGADFGQIKEVKQIMEQNQERIRELQQIMLQLDNEADKTEIQSQITVLELQNLNLANQLDEESTGFTLFGWLVRWFYGV